MPSVNSARYRKKISALKVTYKRINPSPTFLLHQNDQDES